MLSNQPDKKKKHISFGQSKEDKNETERIEAELARQEAENQSEKETKK
jgi:hypothetical protein